jgi:hypothetical protein
MTVTADVIAVFRGDTSSLEQSLGNVTDQISAMHETSAGASAGMTGHLGGVGAGADNLGEKIVGGSAALDELGNKGREVGGSLLGMFTSVAGAAGIGGLLDMAKNVTSEMQVLGVQFNATFGSGGSGALSSAVKEANTLGVSISSAASAAVSFGQATRGTVQDPAKDMKAFSDVAAGTGQNIDSVAAAFGNYYQLVQQYGGTGGAASRASRSLLANHDITAQEANKLRLLGNTGGTPNELLNSLIGNSESLYGGAGKAYAKTLPGEEQTFKNQFSTADSGALSPITGALTSGLGALNKDMSSEGFKTATADVEHFLSEMVKGVEVLAPFAEAVLGIVTGIGELVSKMGFVGEATGVVVAGFVAMKAVDIAGMLVRGVSALGEQAAADVSTTSATAALTAAIVAQTEALAARNAEMAEGMVIGGAGGVTGGAGGVLPTVEKEVAGPSEEDLALLNAPGLFSRLGSGLAGTAMGGGLGAGLLVGGVGYGIGTGVGDIDHNQNVKTVGQDAGIGAGVGAMFGPEGIIPGAIIGGLAGAFENASNAAKAFADKVNESVSSYHHNNPTGTTAAEIEASHKKALEDAARMTAGPKDNAPEGINTLIHDNEALSVSPRNPPKSNIARHDEGDKIRKDADTAYAHMKSNVNFIQERMGPTETYKEADKLAASNGINLSSSLGANKEAIDTVTAALNKLGGVSQQLAEAQASGLKTTSDVLSGTYGETSVNASKQLKKYGSSFNDVEKIAKDAGININTEQYGNLTKADFNQKNLTPQDASQTNANLSAQQGLKDATFAVTQAQWSEVQASQSLVQAHFSAGQAVFGFGQAVFAAGQAAFALTQANFQLGQATFAVTQAQFAQGQAAFALGQAEFAASQATFELGQALYAAGQAAFQVTQAHLGLEQATSTQANASNATAIALTSGYVPALWNASTSLIGLTSASAGQITAFNNLVSSANAAQAAFVPVQFQYTAMTATLQQTTDALKQYQNTLNQPLAGTGAEAQQQEGFTVKEASINEQIATMEGERVSSGDPRIVSLQAQLAIVQNQAQAATAAAAQTTGLQQFNIKQAQLAPEQSYGTELGAAQQIGDAGAQQYQQTQALDALLPTYDALNTKYQLANTLATAAATAIQTQSQSDQAVVTSTNGLMNAQNGLLTANNNVATAANGVKSAQNGVTTAQNGVLTAANNTAVALVGVTNAEVGVTNAQNGIKTAQNAIAVAGQGVVTAQQNVTNASEAVNASQHGMADATTSLNEATNTADAQINTNIVNFLSALQVLITQIGVQAPKMVKPISDAIQDVINVATLSAAVAKAQAAETLVNATQVSTIIAIADADINNINAGKNVAQSDVNTTIRTLDSFETGGTVPGTGPTVVMAHGGEIILPAGVANEVKVLGGTPLQGLVGAALVDGIESNGDPTILAGGRGPAGGLFQFEPGTWLSNGGGQYAGTTPQGMSGAIAATWEQQVQVFLNATRGDHFGAWGPDLGAGYGYAGPPLPHSPVANKIATFPASMYSNGGFVPGSGGVPAILHGGEFVISNAMLAAMGNGGSATSANSGRSGGMTMAPGAVQVSVEINGSSNITGDLKSELESALNEVFSSINQKWSGS